MLLFRDQVSVAASDVLDKLKKLAFVDCSGLTVKAVAEALNELGFKQERLANDGRIVWKVPCGFKRQVPS